MCFVKIIDDYIGRDGRDKQKEYEPRLIFLVDIWEKAEADATAYLKARDKAKRDLQESKEKSKTHAIQHTSDQSIKNHKSCLRAPSGRAGAKL